MGSLLWFEARGEPLEAQRGVLDVAMNRASAKNQTICQVLKAPGQFQWTKYHNPNVVDKKKEALVDSVSSHPRILRDEKFFFSISPAPVWTKSMVCHRIAHITFCRSKQ